LTSSRRELLLSAAFAVWGLTIAIALLTVLRQPAPPEQVMGAAKVANIDARGPLRWMLCLMLLPVVLPLVLRPVARRLADGAAWARNAVLIAPLVTLWLIAIHQSGAWAVIPCAMVVVACTLLRHRAMQFTRRDVVLLLVFLTTLLGLVDAVPKFSVYQHVLLAAVLVLAVRIAVTFIASPLAPALAFLVAPLGLVLQTGFFARDQRYFGWHALLLVVVTPFVLRAFLRNERRAVRMMTLVVFPLALFAYWNAMSVTTAEGKPRVNFFEDGHALLPASEYLRGELPYRDILPAHGLLEDGFFDYLVFQTGDVTVGRRAKTREVVGALTAIALYALAFAATGSAEGALIAVLLSIMMGTFAPSIRMLAPIAALALIAAAVRWRRPRTFAWAAFATVVCGATSIDFGFYTFVTLVFAVLRTRGATIRAAALGIAAGVVPLFAGFAIFGILDDFVRGTFFETLRVAPAYTLGFFTAPAQMQERRFFPEVLSLLLDPMAFKYLVWLIGVVLLGAALTRRWPRRIEPLVVIGVWMVLTGISYAERHHHYFGMAVAVLLTAWIVRLVRRRSILAVPVIAAAIILANPTTHASVLGVNRAARGTAPAEWIEVRDLPRARGAYWHTRDAAMLAGVQKYLALSLKPGETFFDFTDSGILYYVFNRDCPIRQYEVAFYETEELQREVIRRLESPHVRAVLFREGRHSVDGIPSEWRAPLVHQYIVANFEKDFEEGDVTFWRRR
jgi:hypothetical protein